MRRILASVMLAGALLGACAYPATTVNQGTPDSSLVVRTAPAGAHVFVDGVDSGPAADYDGVRQVLTVSPGPHQISIRLGGAVLYDQPHFFGAGSRVEIK